MAQQTKLFPVTTVGSWTRPEWLIHALRRRQNDEITADEFNRIADDAVQYVTALEAKSTAARPQRAGHSLRR